MTYEVRSIENNSLRRQNFDTISGAAGGTFDHAALSNLDYASSGHTGFASAMKARIDLLEEKQ